MKSNMSTLQKVGVIFIAIGIVLVVIAFFTPPKWIIDASVIKAFGEIIGAVGLLMTWDTIKDAIHRGIDTKVTHNGNSIELTNPDNKDE